MKDTPCVACKITPGVLVCLVLRAPCQGKEGDCMEGYCVKCKAKREMKDAKAVTMKNGKPATQGKCPSCGTTMFKIGKAK